MLNLSQGTVPVVQKSAHNAAVNKVSKQKTKHGEEETDWG